MKTVKALLCTSLLISGFLKAEGIMLDYEYKPVNNSPCSAHIIVLIQALQKLQKHDMKQTPAQRLLKDALQEQHSDSPRTSQQSIPGLTASTMHAQKSKLRAVNDGDKNSFGKTIKAQQMPYSAQNDLSSFIRKLAIAIKVKFLNYLKISIDIDITYQSEATGDLIHKKQKVNAMGTAFIEPLDGHILYEVKIKKQAQPAFINPKFSAQGDLELVTESSEDRFFLHQYHHFDFTTRRFTHEQLNHVSLTSEEKQFRNDFNNACGYIDWAGQQEGLNLASIDAQRRDLYKKNNFARLQKWEPDVLDGTTHRIPLITHKIWVTSDEKPTAPSAQYIKWLESTIANNNHTKDGWVHYFWIESKEKLPEFAAQLANHPNIKLRELSEIDGQFVTSDLYKQAIKERKFGKASDIIRLELLRLMGGFYYDTDYEAFQSFAPYAKAYDMIVGLEPMSPYICNALIGSCPQHPVVEKALSMIQRNLGPDAPDYVKLAPNNGFKTIVETGPALLTFAFALAGGSSHYRNIVLPPQLIYPAQSAEYPYKQVVIPNGKKPAEALGAHYWNTAWMDPKFGSQG